MTKGEYKQSSMWHNVFSAKYYQNAPKGWKNYEVRKLCLWTDTRLIAISPDLEGCG